MGNIEDTNKERQPTSGSTDDLSSDATSKKTLNDIEEAQKDSDASGNDSGGVPSPDGQFDTGDDASRTDTETG